MPNTCSSHLQACDLICVYRQQKNCKQLWIWEVNEDVVGCMTLSSFPDEDLAVDDTCTPHWWQGYCISNPHDILFCLLIGLLYTSICKFSLKQQYVAEQYLGSETVYKLTSNKTDQSRLYSVCLQEMNHDYVTFISILVIYAYVCEGQGSLGAHQAATL